MTPKQVPVIPEFDIPVTDADAIDKLEDGSFLVTLSNGEVLIPPHAATAANVNGVGFLTLHSPVHFAAAQLTNWTYGFRCNTPITGLRTRPILFTQDVPATP